MSTNCVGCTALPVPVGPGTVLPESTTTPKSVTEVGISTQLIIWAMVGFILIELLAIICLLRYCCRARYNRRKRKYTEREIILSDNPDRFTYTNETFSDSKLDITKTNNEQNNFVNSIPIHHMDSKKNLQFDNQNETIMIDDIKTIYDENHKNNQTQHFIKRTHLKDKDSLETFIENDSPRQKEYAPVADYNERMQQEMCSEDVYTLRFSTTVPLEPFDTTAPKQQQSYMYNGCLNRPAFEIVSHADVRPATPIEFEEAKELKIKKRKSSTSPKKWNDDCHQSPNRQQRMYTTDSCDGGIHYKENISLGPTYFESSSWIESKKEKCSSYNKSKHKYGRSYTSPIRLNYGCEKSVRNTGEPVQWHVAGELRTTDWDKLKSYSNMEQNQSSKHHSYCYSSNICDRFDNDEEQECKRESRRSNHQTYEHNERYILTKQFQPSKIPKNISKHQDKLDLVATDDEYDYDENYSNIRHSTIGVNNPFNNNNNNNYNGNNGTGSVGLGGLVEAVAPPDFGDEQSNRKKINSDNINLLNSISTEKNNSKFSFNDLTKLNIDKYFSSRKKNSKNSDFNSNNNKKEINNNNNTRNKINSASNDNDLPAWGSSAAKQHTNNGEPRRKSSSNTSDLNKNKSTLLIDPFTKTIIRDPETNEILSMKPSLKQNIKTTNKDKNTEENYEIDYNELDRNVSLDESDLPSLQPPLQFDDEYLNNNNNNTSNNEIPVSNTKRTSITSKNSSEKNQTVSDKVIKRDNFQSNSRHSTHSVAAKKHESEDFHATNEINLNFEDIYMSDTQRASLLTDHFKRLDELDETTSKKNQSSFKQLNKNFLNESFKNQREESAPTSPKSPKDPPAFNNVIDEIRNFDSTRLKNTAPKQRTNLYEKNLNLLEETHSRHQSIVNNTSSFVPPAQAPPPPVQAPFLILPPPPNSLPPPPPPPPQTSNLINQRKASTTSSTVLKTHSAHLY